MLIITAKQVTSPPLYVVIIVVILIVIHTYIICYISWPVRGRTGGT